MKGSRMFKNRSFQVKFVKDKQNSGNPIETNDLVDNILIAQSYADLATNTATELAKIAITVILVKTGCDLLRTAATAISK
jgi:hypothetical protein